MQRNWSLIILPSISTRPRRSEIFTNVLCLLSNWVNYLVYSGIILENIYTSFGCQLKLFALTFSLGSTLSCESMRIEMKAINQILKVRKSQVCFEVACELIISAYQIYSNNNNNINKVKK
jgi:hypothetical protein